MHAVTEVSRSYRALTENAAVLDFSTRGRLCLTGADRQRFLHGQVTNNVSSLTVGEGCYAALANAKGKMTSDLNIYVLQDEILLDFEPGLNPKVSERLEKFVIADDVQILDAGPSFGMASVIGPKAVSICQSFGWPVANDPFRIILHEGCYLAATPRGSLSGVDIFYPNGDPSKLKTLRDAGIDKIDLEAFETARIENGIPRFGVDMDENTLAPEALGENAISYAKGCYIGQEVIARIRTYGQVAKALRSLRFEPGVGLAKAGDKVLKDGKEVGWITSCVFSPKFQRPVALGYVRKECNQVGTQLMVNHSTVEIFTP